MHLLREQWGHYYPLDEQLHCDVRAFSVRHQENPWQHQLKDEADVTHPLNPDMEVKYFFWVFKFMSFTSLFHLLLMGILIVFVTLPQSWRNSSKIKRSYAAVVSQANILSPNVKPFHLFLAVFQHIDNHGLPCVRSRWTWMKGFLLCCGYLQNSNQLRDSISNVELDSGLR